MAFIWPKAIHGQVVSSRQVMEALINSPRINGDLFSLVPKPAKLFSEMNYRVFLYSSET